MEHLGNNAEIDLQAARDALDRALASAEFRLSGRMSQLLRFLVEATLADRGSELKEIVVGVEVFGRPADYDPKVDPVVRKEARRLRQKLQEYYQGSGSGETFRIDLPKGGYVPVFTVCTPAASAPLPEVVAEPPAVRRRAWNRWVLAAVAALLILTGSLAILRTGIRKEPLVPQPLTGNNGDERSPAISPDGRQIAYAWNPEAAAMPSIYVQALHGDQPRRLTSGSAYENHPAWSPGGGDIAFVRGLESGRYAVFVRRIADGAERLLTEVSAPDHLDWSPDGGAIATSDAVRGSPYSIILVSIANGGRRQITIPPPGSNDTFPRFSPDGHRLAFLRAATTDVTELYLLDLSSAQNPKRLTNENRKIEGFTWAPDAKSLVLSLTRGSTARSLWRIPLEGGEMERIAVAGTSAFTPIWSARAGVLAFAQRIHQINLWRIPTNQPVSTDLSAHPVLVAGSSDLDSSPSVSPDGAAVAFRSTRSGTNEIWRTPLLQNQPTRVTWMNGPLTGSPNWSPDGQWIAYDSRVSGTSDILLMPATGGHWRKLTAEPSNEVIPRWSRDGNSIYFGSDRSGSWQIWKQRVAGGASEQVTWRGGYAATESPDGRYLYFTRRPGEDGLYRMPLGGGDEELVLPGFAGKLWGNWVVATDGIYYLFYPDHDPSTQSTIRFLDLKTKETRTVYRLTKHPVLWDGGMALSPDGKWLVFAELDHAGSNIQLLEPFR